MKKLIAGLIAALISIFMAALSVIAQSADSFSSTSTSTITTSTSTNGTGMMDSSYTWAGIIGAIIIIILGVGLIRRNRRNSNTQKPKGPEKDSSISNPASGI